MNFQNHGEQAATAHGTTVGVNRHEPPAGSRSQDAVDAQGELQIVPRDNSSRWIAAVVLVFVAAILIDGVVLNRRFEWPIVAKYLFSPIVLSGLLTTIWLTALCMVLSIILGTAISVARMSQIGAVKNFGWLYIWLFRGTPLLVQLLFWYNLAALFPTIGFGIPFGPTLWEAPTNNLITPYTAAIIGLTLNETAYMAEIVRAGLMSVDAGQAEAARSLGMKRSRSLLRVILPQAMRFIVPPTGNQVINLLKATSTVSVIALSDLLYSVQAIYARNFDVIPLLIVAVSWYLLLVSILTAVQSRIELFYGRSSR